MSKFLKSLIVGASFLALFVLPADFNSLSAGRGGGHGGGGHRGGGHRGWDGHHGGGHRGNWNRGWGGYYGGYGVGVGVGVYGRPYTTGSSYYYNTYPYSTYNYDDGTGVYYYVR